MKHLIFRTGSEEETIALGVQIGRLLRPGDVLGLDGPLGAGKTRLVRGIAEAMELDPAQVSSPTYVLVHEYSLPRGGHLRGINSSHGSSIQTPLLHVDAYRLSGPEDLDSLGWDRVMGAFGVVVVEWSERILEALRNEPSLARLHIEPISPSERRMDLIMPSAWTTRGAWQGVVGLSRPHATGGRDGYTPCPVTGAMVSPHAPTYPFADERARLADLGRWLSGAYVLSRDLTEHDLDNPDLRPS